jgi:hypothetical protein
MKKNKGSISYHIIKVIKQVQTLKLIKHTLHLLNITFPMQYTNFQEVSAK